MKIARFSGAENYISGIVGNQESLPRIPVGPASRPRRGGRLLFHRAGRDAGVGGGERVGEERDGIVHRAAFAVAAGSLCGRGNLAGRT